MFLKKLDAWKTGFRQSQILTKITFRETSRIETVPPEKYASQKDPKSLFKKQLSKNTAFR